MTDPTPSHDAPAHAPLRGAIYWVAIAFSAYQIWMASFHPLSSQVIRAIHVGFVLLMIFALAMTLFQFRYIEGKVAYGA